MLLGVVAGVLSGTMGIGSGTVVIPALVLLFAFSQKSAAGTCLAVMVPMALVGALRYWMNPRIELRVSYIALIALGAVIGALVGSELASRLPGHVLRRIFAVFIIVVAVRMLLTPGGSKEPVHAGDGTAKANVERLEGGDTDGR